MAFADEFIQGFTTGQQNLFAKQNQKFNLWQQDVEKQDREINKQVLAHKLKELKIQDAIAARNAIKDNLAQMEGTDILQARPDQLEGDVLPSVNPVTGVSPAHFKSMTLPGIEDLGVPSAEVRPQSLQEILANKIKEARGLEDTKIREVSRGSALARGGTILDVNPYVPTPNIVKVTDRNAAGLETDRFVTEDPNAGIVATRARLPQRTSGGGGSGARPSQADIDAAGDAIVAGNAVPLIPNTGDGIKMTASIQKRHPGFSVKKSEADWRSVRAFLQANGAKAPEIINAADDLDASLTALEQINNTWDRKTFGPLSLQTIFGGQTPQAKEAAAAVTNVKTALRTLRGAGSTATNQILKQIEDTLSSSQSQTDLKDTIGRLRKEGQIRVNSIRNSGNIDSFSQIGPAQEYDWDPVARKAVPRTR
jgi:hypothetical protein